MTAIECLCCLLDEHGIEWENGDAAHTVEWYTPDGRHCSAMYWNPTLTACINDCTPEQVISAAFGDIDRDQLKTENAKLRELVKSMYNDLTHMTFPPDWVTDYVTDMRELGMEVE